jgi:hypothetical protein
MTFQPEEQPEEEATDKDGDEEGEEGIHTNYTVVIIS